MQDTIEINLPSGSKATIRNYTTRADDAQYEAVLYKGVESVQKGIQAEVTFPLENIMGAKRTYVNRLVVSIDGNADNVLAQLENLRTADYEMIEDEVSKIVEENSPKAKEANKASKNAMTGK